MLYKVTFRLHLGYINSGFPDLAIKNRLECLELFGDSISYYNSIGFIEYSLGNFEKSVRYYKKANAKDSTNIYLIYRIGETSLYAGQYKESLSLFKKWLSKLENSNIISLKYSGMHRVGYAYLKNGYSKEANYYFNLQIEYCNSLIKKDPKTSYAYYDRASVYAFTGDKVKAYSDLEKFNSLETRHQIEHEKVRKWLEEQEKLSKE